MSEPEGPGGPGVAGDGDGAGTAERPPGQLAHPLPGSGLARRVGATLRNVAEVVRFGGLETGESSSPYEIEASGPHYRLRHYYADAVAEQAAPVVLVPPLMLTTEVWDVTPTASAVTVLHEGGLDVWVVDFGHPDRDPGGLERNLTDHVLSVDDAIDRVRKATGQDVVLAGYSQGGMFCYQVAAYRRGAGIDSLVTFGSPVDSQAPLPVPLSPEAAQRLAQGLVESGLFRHLALPGWFSRAAFKMLTPAKTVRNRVRFLMALHDRDALLPRERQRRFLESEGWTAWSGPAFQDWLELYFLHNRMIEGGFDVGDQLVTLADIELPILTVVGTTDTLGHPDSVRAIRRAAPRADVYELTLRAGHFALVFGSTAVTQTWPAVLGWIAWRQGRAELPDEILPADQIDPRPSSVARGAAALAQVGEVGIGAARIAVNTARKAVGVTRGVLTEVPEQLPRLARIGQLDPSTRISLGSLLAEQERKAPHEICFLFGDRAYRRHEVRYRVDSVTRGLVSLGVRHGDRVGVLMDTRPSAFTVIAALSRLGATAVVLRPDGDVACEARLGGAGWIIADPEHAAAAADAPEFRWAVLGGGGADPDEAARPLPEGVVDMERIDAEQVELPAWFSPNPHRADDVAFVLFTGEGETTRAITITNQRWALSALGTASAAALRPGDTVYSVTPIHHSSALLMSVGGAVAGGARFAMAQGSDPDTFWAEVRRYGATHVSYTWTSLRPVVDGPAHPNERYHPIRMFLGSGMPRNLWHRVQERFPDARVLEFYASAEGEAILANLTGERPGSMGRPLPGTPEVRVAAYDLASRTLEHTVDGFARETLSDEIGLLLSRTRPSASASSGAGPVLRGVFAADDAWRSTGDLFLRDAQGEHWLAGSVHEIVDTAGGPVLPAGARFCLSELPASDIVVAYGVPDGDASVLVGALTLRAGWQVTEADLDRVLGRLPPVQRPGYVQVVDEIPLTTWGRPVWRGLAASGVPAPGAGRRVWRLYPAGGRYVELTAAPGA